MPRRYSTAVNAGARSTCDYRILILEMVVPSINPSSHRPRFRRPENFSGGIFLDATRLFEHHGDRRTLQAAPQAAHVAINAVMGWWVAGSNAVLYSNGCLRRRGLLRVLATICWCTTAVLSSTLSNTTSTLLRIFSGKVQHFREHGLRSA